MPVENTGTCREELERTVEEHIVQRTWGRIHGLRVEQVGGRLVVHGRTSTYYVKQLALLAAHEVLSEKDATTVALNLDIQVGESHGRTKPSTRELVSSY